MLLVVVLERDGEVVRGRRCIRLGYEGHVVALHRLHKALGHTVTLRAENRHRQRLQANVHGELTRFPGNVTRAVVRQPMVLSENLGRRRWKESKAFANVNKLRYHLAGHEQQLSGSITRISNSKECIHDYGGNEHVNSLGVQA